MRGGPRRGRSPRGCLGVPGSVMAWTDGDQQRLASGAISLGPFSVADASLNGQTLTRPGMQTTAWICQVPPMLPPADPQSLLVN
jgi:hypothetical protein